MLQQEGSAALPHGAEAGKDDARARVRRFTWRRPEGASSSYHNGLVLITGAPSDLARTTTLASMVAYLNETRKDHIITVEDPIEVASRSPRVQRHLSAR